MKNITINNKTYTIATHLSDINLKTFLAIRDILKQQEYEVKEYTSKIVNKTVKKIVKENTIGFKEQKIKNIIHLLCDVPQDILQEYSQLYSLISNLIDFNSFVDISVKLKKKIDFDGDAFTYIPIEQFIFRQWVDLECMVQNYTDLFYFIVFYKYKNFKYNKMHPNLNAHIEMFGNLNAQEYAPVLLYLINEVANVKGSYKLIYNNESEEEEEDITNQNKKTNLTEHLEIFKWQHIFYSIAEKKVFNSTKGPIYGTDNANLFDVLDYYSWSHNLKKSEIEDEKQKMVHKHKV